MADDTREVRLALVMTGGVSLAVWMGGVAAEVYRMSRSEGLYGDVLDFAGVRLSVDIISGSSAGGLNGALLGMAISRGLPGAEFDRLRDLWFDAGSFSKLLRSPSKKNPPSLLRGDEYFTAQIQQILDEWAALGTTVDLGHDGLEVILTGSLLTPDWRTHSDVFGTVITEPVHRAQFRFTPAHFSQVATLPARLALAARTSASFPGAFEPSFVPIGDKDSSPTRPDMKGIASFTSSRWVLDGGVLMNKPVEPALDAIERRVASTDARRVLAYVNPDPGTPEVSIDTETDMPSLGKVVLRSLISMPRAESIADDLAVIARYNQSFAGQQRGRDRLLWGDWVQADVPRSPGSKVPTLAELRGDTSKVRSGLAATATVLYPHWARRRDIDAVRTRLERHLSATGREVGSVRTLPGGGFTYDELRAALEEQRRSMGWLRSAPPNSADLTSDGTWRYGFTPLEYIGSLALDLLRRVYALLPAVGAASADPRRRELAEIRLGIHRERAWLRALRAADDDYYAYALDHLEDLGLPCATEIALHIYTKWPTPPRDLTDPSHGIDDRVTGSAADDLSREQRLAVWKRVQVLMQQGDLKLLKSGGLPDDPSVIEGVTLAADFDVQPDQLQHVIRKAELRIARRLCTLLIRLGPILRDAVTEYCNSFDPPTRSAVAPGCVAPEELWEPEILEQTADVLGLPAASDVSSLTSTSAAGDLAAQVLATAASLYFVHVSTDPGLGERSVQVDFAQISAAAPNELDPRRRLPADKVAGLQAAHFGAFLKESWRANDWMWGALDAASRLATLVLEPPRLQRLYPSRERALERIKTVFCSPATGVDETRLLDDVWQKRYRDDIVRELGFLDRKSGLPVPTAVPATARALSYALQLTIARRELPEVAAAIERSSAVGADESATASEFVKLINSMRRAGRTTELSLTDVEFLTRKCKVGLERIADEVGSDAGAATTTKIAAVAATAAAGANSGLGPLRYGASVVRTALIATYATAVTAARRSKMSFALLTLLLAVGAGALAARLLGGRVSDSVLVIACFALGLWMLLTGLTARSWGFGIGGLLGLGAIGLSFLSEDSVCSTFATACDPARPAMGWKDSTRWIVPTGLAVLAVVVAVAAWRRYNATVERRRRQTYAAHRFTTQIQSATHRTTMIEAGAAIALVAVAIAYWMVFHEWLFTGDGRSGGRQWVIRQLEGWSRANVLVVIVGLPLIFILSGWIRQAFRDARLARRRARVYDARTLARHLD